MSEMVAAGISSETAADRIVGRDLEAIRDAEYFVAILDGRAVDEGVAFELGGKRPVLPGGEPRSAWTNWSSPGWARGGQVEARGCGESGACRVVAYGSVG